MDKNESEPSDLGDVLAGLSEQITAIGVVVGSALKAVALNDPENAKAIEDNVRLVMTAIKTDGWQARSLGLLDVFYAALQERPPSE